jgi:hypothetical protein
MQRKVKKERRERRMMITNASGKAIEGVAIGIRIVKNITGIGGSYRCSGDAVVGGWEGVKVDSTHCVRLAYSGYIQEIVWESGEVAG